MNGSNNTTAAATTIRIVRNQSILEITLPKDMASSKNGDASHRFQSMSSSTCSSCSKDNSGRVTTTSAPTSLSSTSDRPDSSANIEVQQSPPQQQWPSKQIAKYRSADETPITKPSALNNPLPKECDLLYEKKGDKLAYSRSGESIDLDIPRNADTTTFYLDRHHGQQGKNARNVTTKVAKAMHQTVPEEAEIWRDAAEAHGTNIAQVQQFGQQQSKCAGPYTSQATTTTKWYGHECKETEKDISSGKGTIRTSSGGFATERMPNVFPKSHLLSDITVAPVTLNRLPAQDPGSRGILPPKRQAPSPPSRQAAKAELNYATTGNDKGNCGGQFDSLEEDWVIVNDETEVGVKHHET